MIGRKPMLALVPALAFALTGCGIDWSAEYDEDGNPIPPENDYVSVCTDNTGQRVEDDRCSGAPNDHDDDGPGGLGFVWFYMSTQGGWNTPPVGHRVDRSQGTYRTPKTAVNGGKTPVVARGGSVPSSGGAVQRGGLGASGGKAGSAGS